MNQIDFLDTLKPVTKGLHCSSYPNKVVRWIVVTKSNNGNQWLFMHLKHSLATIINISRKQQT